MAFDYSAFEAYFRGSRQEVVEKLAVYLPFVMQLKIDSINPALDIACGRGEWLELLRKHGLPAEGIEINCDFVRHCTSKGLLVSEADLFAFLSLHNEKKYKLITGFHIIEHLAFEQQQEFFDKTYTKLADGGILILETPNPENSVVGCCNFYIDPTHVRPVPHQLLAFLALQAGFISPVIVKLNRHTVGTALRLMPTSLPGSDMFNQLVELVSSNLQQAPDYALVAFKAPEQDESVRALLSAINSETENYAPQSTKENLDEYLPLLNKELNAAFLMLHQRDEELKKTYSHIQQRNKELQIAYAQIQQRNQELHNALQELEKHEHDSLHTISELQQMDRELQIAYTQVELRNQELQETTSLLLLRDQELQNTQSRLLQCDQELHALKAFCNLKENELHRLNDQIQRLDYEYKNTLFQLRERERELKSVYNTTAGKFIRYYKSAKKKLKKNALQEHNSPEKTQFRVLDSNITVKSSKLSPSAKQAYQQLVTARNRKHHKH